MSLQRKIRKAATRRSLRTRARLASSKPRVSVFRSLKHIYAQLIDDSKQCTVASCSSLELRGKAQDKKEMALAVGKALAQKAQEQGIKEVVFDRGSFLCHGRVGAVAQGLRDGGLQV